MEITEKVAGLIDADGLAKGKTWLGTALMEAASWVIDKVLRYAIQIGAFLAGSIARAEDKNQEGFAELAAVALNDMFGVNVSPSAMKRGAGRGARVDASQQIGDMMLRAFSGQVEGATGGKIEPSDAPAKVFLTAMAQMALEGWLEGWVVEAMTLGQLETFGDLDDTMSHVLGLGRASAAVHGPLVKHLIVTPLEWKIQKEHRPSLLTESMAVAEYLGGFLPEAQFQEEMARQGWSAERITSHVRQHRKFLSLEDSMLMMREGKYDFAQVYTQLKIAGFEDDTARAAIVAAQVKRIAAFRDDSLTAIKSAYVNRQIGDSECRTYLHAVVYDADERSALETAMRTVRELNGKNLSHAEVKEAVRRGILAMSDYRRWLAREGYGETDAFVLELTFRAQLDEEHEVADHALEQVRQRAADQAARDLAARQRKAEIDAERALHRRGSLATLERAVVRGLVPVTRYAEVLQPQYDADTVQIMVDLIQQGRADYLDQQTRAEDARKRAAIRNVDVGGLNQAVLTGVLTLDEFRGRLGQLGFSGADADLLTNTLRARLDDAAAAAAMRAAAEAAAKRKSIDLGRFERLVVRGLRSMGQYDELLTTLGFDEGSRAAMVELVQLQIADNAAAVEQRRLAALKAGTHDVTLEQMRRAVVLGLQSEAAFSTYLITHGFTTDAQAVLLAELRADVADTEAARARRAAAEAASQVRVLPLSTLARAVRLGLVPIDVYDRRLAKDGYSDDDRSIELLLLSFERDDLAAARAKRDAPPPTPDPKGLSLAELARAVKAGVSTVNDYAGRAYQLGYSQEAVETLVAVLGQELDVLDAAQAIHDAPPPAPSRNLSVAQYEAAVKAEAMTLSDFTANVQALGYEEDAAALLTFLLATKLQAATGE